METGYAMAEETSYGYKEQVRTSAVKQKVKKPGFLDRWLFKKLQNGAAYEQKQKQEQEAINMKSASISRGGLQTGPSVIDNQDKSIRFTVHVANGGRVIETQRYDRKSDRHASSLYVVTSEQDFGKEIDKIITMEALR